jgi:hypothetical protein
MNFRFSSLVRPVFIVLFTFLVVHAIVARRNLEDASYVPVDVTVANSISKKLESKWQTYYHNPSLPEYAECVSKFSIIHAGSKIHVIIEETIEGRVENATPTSIDISCGSMPTLHSHPPTECNEDATECRVYPEYLLGPSLCEPSDADLKGALQVTRPTLDFIQCGPRRIIGYISIFSIQK